MFQSSSSFIQSGMFPYCSDVSSSAAAIRIAYIISLGTLSFSIFPPKGQGAPLMRYPRVY